MSDRNTDPEMEFDELEPLPPEAELAELPDEAVLADLPDGAVLEELPAEAELAELPDEVLVEEPVKAAPAPKPVAKAAPKPVAKAAPKPVVKPAAKPAIAAKPAAVVTPKPAAAAAAKPAAAAAAAVKPGAAAPAAGAAPAPRKPRGERSKPEPKKKKSHWERWTGEGEKPKREMETAPKLLRKAAFGLTLGCLLPWGGLTADSIWYGNVGEKLLVLFGLYVWHQAHLFRDGVKVPGFISKLGAKNFIGLFVLAGLLVVLGFAPIFSMGSFETEEIAGVLGPFAEKGFLILAGLTMTHIYDYEHGGHFNPMFPLMFLAPGIAGVMSLLKIFSVDSIGIGQILGGIGSIAVGGAGWMAAYTMYVALKEAKAHGDAKKAAQLEARKVARKSR